METIAGPSFRLTYKQGWFVHGDADEIMYSGAFGAGKTIVVALRAYLRARHPRAVEVLARAKLDDVRDTVLPHLFEGSGDTPAILAPGTYIWNKAERWIRLIGGGLIRYVGLGDRQRNELDRMRFRGANITGLGIDQAEEISQRQYLNALGRVRTKGTGLNRSVYGSCNPAAPSHWIAKRFGIKAGHDPQTTPLIKTARVLPDGTTQQLRAIMTASADNPHLPRDYLARLATYTGIMRLRYVLGMWVGSEGLIYDNFRRGLHLVDPGPGVQWARSIIGMDDGTTMPCAILLMRCDGDGRLHVEREVYRRGMTSAEKVRVVKDLAAWAGGVEAVVVDPAASGIKGDLRAAGLPVIDGDNRVLAGIAAVRQALELGPDGLPRLTLNKALERIGSQEQDAAGPVGLLEEIEAYEWDPEAKAEKPVKRYDHACLAPGTLVTCRRGKIPIENVTTGDQALTRAGWRPIVASGMTEPWAQRVEVLLSNGARLVGTGNHPVWVEGRGWTCMDTLRYGDVLCTSQKSSSGTGIAAPVRVVGVRPAPSGSVYNLTVEGEPEFYANGVLVHNCDAKRYGVMYFDCPPALVFDTSGLEQVEAATKADRSVVHVGTLTHAKSDPKTRDMRLHAREYADVAFRADPAGPLRVWAPITKGGPRREDIYTMFAVAGDSGCESFIVVGELRTRRIVGQWQRVTTPERLARVCAMMSLWWATEIDREYGEPVLRPAAVGFLRGVLSVPGMMLAQGLGSLNVTGEAWEPDQREFAEAIGLVRAAWEAGSMRERDPAVFTTARQYVYTTGTMLHASLVGDPSRRSSHADGLMARAGLWRMMAGVPIEEIPEPAPPRGSPEFIRRQHAEEKAGKRGDGIAFG